MTLPDSANVLVVPSAKPAGQRRTPIRLVLRGLSLLGIAYVCVCTLACSMQERLIFPREMAAWAARGPNDPPPPGVEDWWISADSGDRVPAYWMTPPGRERPASGWPVLVIFHGNGEVIDRNHRELAAALALREGVAVLIPEYRGYGRAGGAPGQAAIAADMRAFAEKLKSRDDVDPSRIVYFGRSLGGGVAWDLARTHRPRAVITQSTFTSIRAMAARSFIPGFLVRHPFDNAGAIREINVPVLLFHGSRDGVVPVSHSRRLAELARAAHPGRLVRLVEEDADHNDFPRDERAMETQLVAFWREIGLIAE